MREAILSAIRPSAQAALNAHLPLVLIQFRREADGRFRDAEAVGGGDEICLSLLSCLILEIEYRRPSTDTRSSKIASLIECRGRRRAAA